MMTETGKEAGRTERLRFLSFLALGQAQAVLVSVLQRVLVA
jgi:hypothetical protein